MGKPFLLLDNAEDIFPLVWVAVVMLGSVIVNETRTASWYFVKNYLTTFFGDNVSENKCFALDINCELKSAFFVPINEE